MSQKQFMKKGLVVLTATALLATGAVAKAADIDNNPPGPTGGSGTNWENPPGPKGGPGASPDHRQWDEWFKAHPGFRGKADRNHDGVIDENERLWARKRYRRYNPPGPVGGPGAGPAPRHDRDNNPPGPRGGRGTNWENPPGPKGGPGASPDRRGGETRHRR